MPSIIDLAIIIIYFLVMIFVGFYYRRHKSSSEDFFLAERKLSTLHVVGSTFSTLIGLTLIFLMAGFAYQYGISAIWGGLAAFLGFVILALVSPRIKSLSDRNQAITIPELIEHKLGGKFKLISSLVIIIIFTTVIAAEFLISGSILSSFLKIPLLPAVIVTALLITLYSLIGGFKTVVITDVIQMFLILLSIPIMFFILFQTTNGIFSFSQLSPELLNPFNIGIPAIIGLFLMTVLAYFSSQDIFQRIYASKTQAISKRAMLLTGIITFILILTMIPIGLMARVAFPSINPNEIIPTLIQQFPIIGLSGLLIVGYLATSNSTADTELLTVTSNIVRDFKIGKQRNIIAISRLIVLIVASISIVIATLVKNILTIGITLINWFGIIGVVILAALFWKRTNSTAAIIALITGFIAATVYTILTGDLLGASLVGLIPTVVLLVTLSFFIKQKSV